MVRTSVVRDAARMLPICLLRTVQRLRERSIPVRRIVPEPSLSLRAPFCQFAPKRCDYEERDRGDKDQKNNVAADLNYGMNFSVVHRAHFCFFQPTNLSSLQSPRPISPLTIFICFVLRPSPVANEEIDCLRFVSALSSPRRQPPLSSASTRAT